MEEKEYNKIARLFQFLNNNFTPINYNYDGFNGSYKTYSIDDIQFPDDTMRLIEDLRYHNVSEFYDLYYLKSNGFPESYYSTSLVKKSEKEYGFHYQLATILFYFIFSKLKKSAMKFLEVIDSEKFKSHYGHLAKRDEYDFEYPSVIHAEVFKYFNSKVTDFDMLFHLLNWLSDMSYNDGSMTVYKIKRIESCINNLKKHDFENYDFMIKT